MKKLEEDETIKDKGEQTTAADCTLPKKAKNVQKMPKTFKTCLSRINKSFRSHITMKNCQKRSKSEFKTCSSLLTI